MSVHRTLKRLAHLARVSFTSFAALQLSIGGTLAQAGNEKQEEKKARITGHKVRFSTSLPSSAKIVPWTIFSQPTSRSMARTSTIFFPRASSRKMARDDAAPEPSGGGSSASSF